MPDELDGEHHAQEERGEQAHAQRFGPHNVQLLQRVPPVDLPCTHVQREEAMHGPHCVQACLERGPRAASAPAAGGPAGRLQTSLPPAHPPWRMRVMDWPARTTAATVLHRYRGGLNLELSRSRPPLTRCIGPSGEPCWACLGAPALQATGVLLAGVGVTGLRVRTGLAQLTNGLNMSLAGIAPTRMGPHRAGASWHMAPPPCRIAPSQQRARSMLGRSNSARIYPGAAG